LLVEISDAGTHESKKIIIDSMNPTDYLIVPESIPGLSSESKMWSYYNEISVKEKEKNLIQGMMPLLESEKSQTVMNVEVLGHVFVIS
jgi:hypothetical protein